MLAEYPDLEPGEGKEPWEMTKAEFGQVTKSPTGRRFNITGEAQKIRVAEEGQSQYFTSEKKAQEWIDKKHEKIVQ